MSEGGQHQITSTVIRRRNTDGKARKLTLENGLKLIYSHLSVLLGKRDQTLDCLCKLLEVIQKPPVHI